MLLWNVPPVLAGTTSATVKLPKAYTFNSSPVVAATVRVIAEAVAV